MHKHQPQSEGRLRIKWLPVFIDGNGGGEVLVTGAQPSTERVEAKRLLFPVQLHDGVMSHAAARRLDNLDYGFHPVIRTESIGRQNLAMSGGSSPSRLAAIRTVRDEKMPNIEELFRQAQGSVTIGPSTKPGRVWFITGPVFQK